MKPIEIQPIPESILDCQRIAVDEWRNLIIAHYGGNLDYDRELTAARIGMRGLHRAIDAMNGRPWPTQDTSDIARYH